MATTVTPNAGLSQSDATESTQIARGAIALTADYGGGATHGDVLNLAYYGIQSNNPPLEVEIFEAPPAGTAPSGFTYLYAPGTNPSNGQIVVLAPTGAAAGDAAQEYPQGTAYNAALLAAKLFYKATFSLGN